MQVEPPPPAVENFTALVFKIAAGDTWPPSPDRKELIEKRLSELITRFHTPHHPPYPQMIEQAIQELNEKEGSTEESISQFIRKAYDDLPWAHSTLLEHHLHKLDKSGGLVLTSSNGYMLPNGNGNSNCGPKRKPKKPWKRRSMSQAKKPEPQNGDDFEFSEPNQLEGPQVVLNYPLKQITKANAMDQNKELVRGLGFRRPVLNWTKVELTKCDLSKQQALEGPLKVGTSEVAIENVVALEKQTLQEINP